jgi:tellurite resistance protein TehA-like permease
MGFILVVTLLVLGLGIGAALLPFVAFRSKLTRPFGRAAKAK